MSSQQANAAATNLLMIASSHQKTTTTRPAAAVRRRWRRQQHCDTKNAPCLYILAALLATIISNVIVVVTADLSTNLAPLDAGQQPNIPTTCPLVRVCRCKWSNGKQIANCERQNLQTIPSQLPVDTQVLEMNGNQMSQLTKHVFQEKHMTNLQRIFLSECGINYIADEAFAQLTNLVELDLSHNQIQQVPTKSFDRVKYSLRKLSLAHNQLLTIDTNSFAALIHLDVLDLSNNRLSQLKPNAFRHLTKLRELKLNDNKLVQLPLNVMTDLSYSFSIDLYGNPWFCDCNLRQSIDLMIQHGIQQSIQPICASPQKIENLRWNSIKPDDYMCPPVLTNKQVERIVGAGSNISLECTAQGSSPITFVWYQDERNLTTNQGHSGGNMSGPPQSTKLLDERRYEIVEDTTQPNTTTSILYLYNLQMTDTSIFLCWVENPVGNSMANFSLIVNDSPPAGLADSISYGGASNGLGSGASSFFSSIFNNQHGETQLGLMALLLAIILLIVVVLLLIVKQMKNRSSKSSQSSDLKQIKSKHNNHHHHQATLTSGGKFAANSAQGNNHNHHNQRSMFADSDEDVDNEYEVDGRSSSNSSSSCKKNPKVMTTTAGEHLDGFLEHMRSGIINLDYHSMSPVMQFNNTNNTNTLSHSKGNSQLSSQVVAPCVTSANDQSMLYNQHQHHLQHLQQQQQLEMQLRLQQQHQLLSHQQQPYLDTTDHHMMHHFPSASNTSTVVPCYYDGSDGRGGGGGGGGTASMTTTTSDLSPSSGSGNTNFTMTNGPNNLPPYMTVYMGYPQQQQQ